jgi:serine/threonine protein kinase
MNKKAATQKKIRHSKKHSLHKGTRKQRGGKVLGSGAYGCIFKPPLLCKGQESRSNNYITKLMTNKHANQELREINELKPYVARIPNADRYFILNGISSCIPQSFTENDLQNFDSKCYALTKKGIKAQDVEEKVKHSLVLGIQMPDGGLSASQYLSDPMLSNKEVKDFILALKNLIVYGIHPLNKAGVIHADIKSQNMVYNPETKELRLIDWGLAKVVNQLDKIPMLGMPLMFNEPLTNLFYFNYTIEDMLYKALQKTSSLTGERTIGQILLIPDPVERENELRSDIYQFLWEKIFYSKRMFTFAFKTGDSVLGHYKYLTDIYFDGDSDLLHKTITRQLTDAIYTNCYDAPNNKFYSFDSLRYFDDVFRMNVDVFGALSVLNDIGKNKLNNDDVIDKIIDIRKIILFSNKYAGQPYDIDVVTKYLDELVAILS